MTIRLRMLRRNDSPAQRSVDELLSRRPWLSSPDIFSYGFMNVDTTVAETDIEIIDRLISAYSQAVAEDPYRSSRKDDVWSQITKKYHGELVDLITRHDQRALASYLLQLPRKPAGHGFIQGEEVYRRLQSNPKEQWMRALWLMDQLVGMAEALGLLSVRCSEQGDWTTVPSGASAASLRSSIETKIGFPITFPSVMDGLFALQPEDGPIHLRSISAAYAIDRLAKLMRNVCEIDTNQLRVAELGGGIGYTALAARNLAIEKYVIYDIPEVNFAQGFFLLKILPGDDVVLFGEPETNAPVSVLPHHAFEHALSSAFHATINMDSFPEIAEEDAHRYFQKIPQCSRWLFSINQEARAQQTAISNQWVVREMAGAYDYKEIFRYPNWVRQGYVEELWECP